MAMFSGPMFQPAESDDTRSIFGKEGGHYNISAIKSGAQGMGVLRRIFPDGEANEYNLCLFSTSGIHGTYTTIEESEAWTEPNEEWGDERPDVTVLIIHPRVCALVCGVCCPETPDDFAFLKKLRASSWAVAQRIGAPA